jgi:hypothetical protein
MKRHLLLILLLFLLDNSMGAQVIQYKAQTVCEIIDSLYKDIHTLSYNVEVIKKSYSSDSIIESEAVVNILRKQDDTLGYYHHITDVSRGFTQMYNGDAVLYINQVDNSSVLFLTKLHGIFAITGSAFHSFLISPAIDEILESNCSKESEFVDFMEVKPVKWSNRDCLEVVITYKDFEEFQNQISLFILDLNTYLPLQFSTYCHFNGIVDSTVYKYSNYVINGIMDSTIFTLEKSVPDHDKLELFQFKKDKEKLKTGTVFPDLHGISHKGDTINLYNSQSKVFILNFWFVGCYPCTKAFKDISNYLMEKESEGISLLGVNGVNSFDQFTSYIERMNLESLHISVEPPNIEHINLNRYPTIYILDEKMEILLSIEGWNEEKFSLLKEQIDKMTLD